MTVDYVHVSCRARNNEVALCGLSLIGSEDEETTDGVSCPECVGWIKHGTCPQCGAKSGKFDRLMRHTRHAAVIA